MPLKIPYACHFRMSKCVPHVVYVKAETCTFQSLSLFHKHLRASREKKENVWFNGESNTVWVQAPDSFITQWKHFRSRESRLPDCAAILEPLHSYLCFVCYRFFGFVCFASVAVIYFSCLVSKVKDEVIYWIIDEIALFHFAKCAKDHIFAGRCWGQNLWNNLSDHLGILLSGAFVSLRTTKDCIHGTTIEFLTHLC